MAPVLPPTQGWVRARGAPVSLPASLEKSQQLRPSKVRAWSSDPRSGGSLLPFLCVYPPIKRSWCPWTKLAVAAQSHHHMRALPSVPKKYQSCLVTVWGTPLQNPILRLGFQGGYPGGRQLRGRDVTERSPAGGASEQVTPWASLPTSSVPGSTGQRGWGGLECAPIGVPLQGLEAGLLASEGVQSCAQGQVPRLGCDRLQQVVGSLERCATYLPAGSGHYTICLLMGISLDPLTQQFRSARGRREPGVYLPTLGGGGTNSSHSGGYPERRWVSRNQKELRLVLPSSHPRGCLVGCL